MTPALLRVYQSMLQLIRGLMLLGVALDLALTFFVLSTPRHDVFHGDAETPFAVLLMYSLLVLWATTNTDPARWRSALRRLLVRHRLRPH